MLLLDELFMLPREAERPSFDLNRIETRDWRGVDITKESRVTISVRTPFSAA